MGGGGEDGLGGGQQVRIMVGLWLLEGCRIVVWVWSMVFGRRRSWGVKEWGVRGSNVFEGHVLGLTWATTWHAILVACEDVDDK